MNKVKTIVTLNKDVNSKEDILKLVEEDKFRKTNLDTLNDFFEK